MKSVLFQLKIYIYDILTTFVSVFLIYTAFKYNNNPQNILLYSLIINLVYLLIIIYLRIRERDSYFLSFKNRKHKDDWIGAGELDFSRSDQCFSITNSEAGYIFSKCLAWSNYKYSFEFKIINRCLGVLMRSVNLSNCIMMQISTEGVNPHIRVNGSWKVWNHKDLNFTFDNNLSLNRWYKGEFLCDNNTVNIKIFLNGKCFFEYVSIP
jgi:hypothetical protein